MTSMINTNGVGSLASQGEAWNTSSGASDDTGHLRAQVATVHRCSWTLTDGHRPNIWQPGAMTLDSICEQGLRHGSRQAPQMCPKIATAHWRYPAQGDIGSVL
jgi:hypothetical protein